MTRDEIAGVMAMIVVDCEADAAAPVPFTQHGLGTSRGEMLAQIAAVARAVELLAETDRPDHRRTTPCCDCGCQWGEPWSEDLAEPECVACHHVCAHPDTPFRWAT